MEGQLTPNSLMTTSPERKPVTELQAIRADERFPLISNVIGNLLVLNRFRYVKYSNGLPFDIFPSVCYKDLFKIESRQDTLIGTYKTGEGGDKSIGEWCEKKNHETEKEF